MNRILNQLDCQIYKYCEKSNTIYKNNFYGNESVLELIEIVDKLNELNINYHLIFGSIIVLE